LATLLLESIKLNPSVNTLYFEILEIVKNII
jgi:hypothetical protein